MFSFPASVESETGLKSNILPLHQYELILCIVLLQNCGLLNPANYTPECLSVVLSHTGSALYWTP